VVPALAARSASADGGAIDALVGRRVLLLLAVGAAGLLGMALLGAPVLHALFGGRRFADAQLASLWWLLLALGGLLLGMAPASVFASAFYASGNTRAPALAQSLVYTGGLLLRGLLFQRWGALGIAVAISLQTLAGAAALGLAFAWRERR
jgi:peptidoglycan biosynthesis protein MviN/MurJ (putative lipid II flippase)